MSQDWKSRRQRGTVFWYYVITWIALWAGRPVTRALIVPITLYFFAFGRSCRAVSRKFLALVFARPATLVESFHHHLTFGSTILDRIFLLSGKQDSLSIQMFGAAPILEKVARGEGCLLLGSHLGSFEILRALGARHEHFSLKVLMNEEHNQGVTQILNKLNPDVADTVISGRPLDVALAISEALESGALVGLMGDRVSSGEKAIHCNFFDKPASFPTTAANLALTLGVPVYLFFGIYKGGNRYDIHFELLGGGERLGRRERQSEVERLTHRYAQRLEYYARQAPYNWFNFYDFWKLE